jgi:hypothetical protein
MSLCTVSISLLSMFRSFPAIFVQITRPTEKFLSQFKTRLSTDHPSDEVYSKIHERLDIGILLLVKEAADDTEQHLGDGITVPAGF